MRREPSATNRAIRFIGRLFFAALASSWLFTFGWLSRRNRGLISHICRHFGLREKREPQQLPTVRAETLFAQDVPVRILQPDAADGNVSLAELLILCRSVAEGKPRCLLELGTFDGRTTLNIAANVGDKARVYTLDLPAEASAALAQAQGDAAYVQKPASGARFKGTAWESRIEQWFGDSATFDFSPVEGKCGWVFVDAAHSYEYVLNDSKVALRALSSEGGVIFWHDYGVWDGVTRALNELAISDPAFAQLQHIEGTSLVILRVPPTRLLI